MKNILIERGVIEKLTGDGEVGGFFCKIPKYPTNFSLPWLDLSREKRRVRKKFRIKRGERGKGSLGKGRWNDENGPDRRFNFRGDRDEKGS